MNKTNIEYLTHTWNPIAMRCDPVSEGCKNCWHLALANRLSKNPLIPEDRQKAYAGGKPVLVEKKINAPLKLKNPSIIGVQFMGDLFHKDISDWMLDAVFERICYDGISHHVFTVLTKRAERMLEYTSREYIASFINQSPNIVGMVTIENQKQADARIPLLLQTSFARRGISIEPMLSKIDLKLTGGCHHCIKYGRQYHITHPCEQCGYQGGKLPIDWVIVGGESGSGARPMHSDWVRSIRDQCQKAGVNFFFKQWGEWAEMKQMGAFMATGRVKNGTHTGRYDLKYYDETQANNVAVDCAFNDIYVYRVGKKKASRILDGRIWDEMPKWKNS